MIQNLTLLPAIEGNDHFFTLPMHSSVRARLSRKMLQLAQGERLAQQCGALHHNPAEFEYSLGNHTNNHDDDYR